MLKRNLIFLFWLFTSLSNVIMVILLQRNIEFLIILVFIPHLIVIIIMIIDNLFVEVEK